MAGRGPAQEQRPASEASTKGEPAQDEESASEARPPRRRVLASMEAAPLPTADAIESSPFMESFDKADAVCQGLMSGNAEAAALVPSFLATSDAARGWFVTSLTTPDYREAPVLTVFWRR